MKIQSKISLARIIQFNARPRVVLESFRSIHLSPLGPVVRGLIKLASPYARKTRRRTCKREKKPVGTSECHCPYATPSSIEGTGIARLGHRLKPPRAICASDKPSSLSFFRDTVWQRCKIFKKGAASLSWNNKNPRNHRVVILNAIVSCEE